ncbi:hypothetical protein [Methylophilus sp. QUAN]|uniref:hypothetical protein n=1 Tax=Methylophilus sp. QUAN TaxID=2781020 RepID=UPI0018908F20|nr:hypothetical protein [Methylophilus sp. QUAN]MBF4991035.1 hypothetical protein [Methylophilus sp. QUAN]
MKIQSILKKALFAQTVNQIQSFYGQIRAELDSHNKYKYLEYKPHEDKACLENGSSPLLTFNYMQYLPRVFCTKHGIRILFEIKDKGFVAHVILVHFKDGRGRHSKSLENIREESIDFTNDENATIKDAFEKIATLADSWNVGDFQLRQEVKARKSA